MAVAMEIILARLRWNFHYASLRNHFGIFLGASLENPPRRLTGGTVEKSMAVAMEILLERLLWNCHCTAFRNCFGISLGRSCSACLHEAHLHEASREPS